MRGRVANLHERFAIKRAPPTRNPSISGFIANSSQLPAFTLPPYWILTLEATSGETFSLIHFRTPACTSCAWSGVATYPYNSPNWFVSDDDVFPVLFSHAIEDSFELPKHTFKVSPASLCANDSPMHATTFTPVSNAYLVFKPTNSFVSPHKDLLSECPKMTTECSRLSTSPRRLLQ